MLVLDANVAVFACSSPRGLEVLRGRELLAPPLMWSEFLSSVHRALWRREISPEQAAQIRAAFDRLDVERRSPRRLAERAWQIAELLGWARTFDAEYVALADLTGSRVITLDRRMRRGADRLGLVIRPDEL